ncbi:DUF4158 domain-containing protein [Nonomuraea sp. B5E05]|uniref:DUF4158 domain-containing protein n=1 Tax=Nonomuraea sp. B5E05 TaxID=3153569 RepID=UPI00326021FD
MILSGHDTTPLHIDELVEHWTILDEERELISGKRGATRLAFGILLKFHTQHGRFPRGRSELADEAIEHVAKQVKVHEFKTKGPAYRTTVQTTLRASYTNHYRRDLIALTYGLVSDERRRARARLVSVVNAMTPMPTSAAVV